MKKKVLYSVLAIILAFSLTACGGEKEVSTPVTEEITPATEKSTSATEDVKQETVSQTTEPQKEQTVDILPETENQAKIEKPHFVKTIMGYYDEKKDEDIFVSLRSTMEYFLLDEDSAKQFPKLAKTLEGSVAERQATLKSSTETLEENLDELVACGDSGFELYNNTVCKVLRADDKVFSYQETNGCYLGGAHGVYHIGGKAYDVETGAQLALIDLIKDETKMKEVAITQLKEYGDIYYVDLEELDKTLEEYELSDFTWYIDYFGVTLYFNLYELGPYVSGDQSVFLSFAEYPEMFEKKYSIIPEEYILELEEFEEINADLDGDGKDDTLQIIQRFPEDECENIVSIIKLNGKEINTETWAFSTDYYLVKTKNGVYLYFFHQLQNDYSYLEVYDLRNGKLIVDPDDNTNLFLINEYDSTYNEEGGCSYIGTEDVFTDPNWVKFGTYLSTLSTYSGTRTYCIGAKGLPEAKDSIYTVDLFYLLKTLKDVPCKNVKADKLSLGTDSVIPKDTYLKIVGAKKDGVYVIEAIDYVSDKNEDYVFYGIDEKTKFNEDDLYYIQLDSDYGWEIGGESIGELFEGLTFAN